MNFEWNPEQQAAYDDAVAFAERDLTPDPAAPADAFDREAWQRAGDYGVLGWCMPEAYGGHGHDVLSTIHRLEALGRGCRDNALTLGLNGQLWSVQVPLLEFGDEGLKQKYLKPLCEGTAIAAHGMTEEASGSDAFSLETRAERVDGGYLLNGRKKYIGLSYVADFALVFASTNPSNAKWGISAFIVERNFEGYSAIPPPAKLGLDSNPLGEIELKDCFVPEENRMGAEGIGMSVFNHSMGWERAFIFASHVGSMARQLDECIAYSRERRQFGQPIAQFQSVSNRIANMQVRLETSRLLLYKLAWLKDQGEAATLEAATAKLHIAESFVENSMDAIRIHGAKGYLKGYGIEQDLRDSIGGVIYSGTSDIQRNIIARLLGAG